MSKWSSLSVLILFAATAAAQDRTCWLRDGVSPSPSLVYLLCEQGAFLVTADAGATWSTREIKATGHLRNIDFIDANHGFAVGDGGLLMATADAGKTWSDRKSGAKENLAIIQFVGQSGWAAGYDGVIIHTSDGGNTWTKQETGTKEALEGLFFLDADHGWAVGWAGTILRTTDGGKTWQHIKSDAAQWSLTSVLFRDAQNGWIVGFGGTILRSKDGGATWTALTSPVKTWLSAIEFDGQKRGWIAADNSILMSEDGGESWKSVPIADMIFISQFVPVNGSLWAIGQLGVLKQTGGTNWKRLENLVVDDPAKEPGMSTPAAGKPN